MKRIEWNKGKESGSVTEDRWRIVKIIDTPGHGEFYFMAVFENGYGEQKIRGNAGDHWLEVPFPDDL